VDASTPLDFRLLSPIHATLILLSVVWFSNELAEHGRLFGRLAVFGFVVYSFFSCKQVMAWYADQRADGQGYASASWRHSELLSMARHLASGTLIYTTSPCPIYLYTGRSGFEIPTQWDRDTLRPNKNLSSALGRVRQETDEGKAVLIYFTEDSEPVFPTMDDLSATLKVPCVRTPDGAFCGKIPSGYRYHDYSYAQDK
jgi:hypothetical protein